MWDRNKTRMHLFASIYRKIILSVWLSALITVIKHMSLYINFMYVNKCAKTTKWQRELYQNTCIYNNQRFHCAYSAFINVYKANMQIPQYQLQSTILGLKGESKFQCSKELYSVTKWYFVIMCVLVHFSLKNWEIY